MLSCFQQELLSSQDASVTKLLDSQGPERRDTQGLEGIILNYYRSNEPNYLISGILKRRNVKKKNIFKKNLMREVFFLSREKE